jgi:hypothetical protein
MSQEKGGGVFDFEEKDIGILVFLERGLVGENT